MTNYFKSDGSRITLGRKLGQGGEGAVFEITEQTDLVAKIYNVSPSPSQIAKLEAMIALTTEDLLRVAAWPTATIHKTKGGNVAGFVMPKLEGYKPVHELYSPKSRRVEFPGTDWRFLINTAANISRAFGIIHNHNHVIGDVNHGNLVVARDGTVKLIDVDSFQVYTGNTLYYCGVGVPEYTPPELASADFATTMRNPNHDTFGLAVLNFHLLFLGRHPYAGRYLGTGYMPIDRAIRENRFVYGADSQSKMMAAPPNTIPLSYTSRPVVQLFENAFNSTFLFHTRPTAKDWVLSLVDLSKDLKQCINSSAHFYIQSLGSCPWCAFEKKIGIDFFPSRTYTTVQSFNIDSVWPGIQNIKRPAFVKMPQYYGVELSPEARSARKRLRLILLLYFAAIAIPIEIGVLANSAMLSVMLMIVAILGMIKFGPTRVKTLRQFNIKCDLAQADCEAKLSMLNTPLREFDVEYGELKMLKEEHQKLPMERAKGFEDLKNNIRQNQLNRHLEQFEVSTATLYKIGEGRKQMLMSFGIETAADVGLQQVSAVPGFGPTFSKILMDWRTECEKSFKFDYSKGIDPQDIAKLDKKINTKRSQIESRLLNGAGKLQTLLNDFNRIKALNMEALDVAAETFAQAKYDREYLGK